MRADLPALVIALAAVGAPAAAAQAVTGFTLENGLRALVIEDHRAPVATQMLWYPVGSADEPWGKSGIAHFLEHLMFKGTEKIAEGNFSRIVAENGGEDNAFTSYDYTGYFQRIAADRLPIVMEMEADRMRNLVISEEATRTERDVILEERSQRTDNSPQSLFSEQMTAALYQNHPYAMPVIGWRHEMEGLTREDALAFYERFYAPDNAILIVAGAVDPAEVERLARQHYGPLQPSGRPPEARPSEPPHRAARRIVMEDDRVRQPYVVRQYLVPSRGNGDAREAAALELLSEILGDGVTSRFSERLELGDRTAIDTGAWYSATSRDLSSFAVYAVPASGVSLEAVEAGLDAVLADILRSGVSEEELERVKTLKRASEIYAQDSLSSQARRYGAALAIGLSVEDVEAWPDLLQAVTAEEVRAVAARYLVPARSVTGWLVRSTQEQG